MPQRIQQIQSIVAQRGIEHLVHFTRVDNLASIMQNGIIPIANTAQNQINPVINDPYRWDGHTNASCLSITRPNHHMFSGYVAITLKLNGLFYFCVQLYFGKNHVHFVATMLPMEQ